VPLEKTPRDAEFSADGRTFYFTEAGVSAVQALDPATAGIDRLDDAALARMLIEAHRDVVDAVLAAAEPIARATALVAEALERGGRVVLVGAGTSGRLAVLDAAELPPTFGVDPALVEARIAGVTRVGLFVRLAQTGADGFIPAATLGADYFRFEEASRALVGTRSGETFRLGDKVEVKLVEAAPFAGALRFEMLSPGGQRRNARRGSGREAAGGARRAKKQGARRNKGARS